MRKAVIVIGAGKSQVLVIKKAKSMGFAVIGVDRDRNAPGFTLCDEKVYLSTYESQPIIERIKDLMTVYDLRGVINRSSGVPVVTCADICSAFHLPGVATQAVKKIIDKSQLISFCNKNNISAPHCIAVNSFKELNQYTVRYPCIVKPALSTVGKCGVTHVEREKELEQAFKKAKKISVTGFVNIEEYIEGRDVSLISVVRDGVVYPITLLDEINTRDQSGEIVGVGFAVPSIFTNQNEELKIHALAADVVTTFNLGTTIFIMSCRCNFKDNPRLIEIHLDLGGDLVLDQLIPASTDFDIVSFFIRVLTGDEPKVFKNDFTPAAIIYGREDGLISERGCTLIQRNSREELSKVLDSLL
ncbi:ATP-grasp domain-containing protein [Methanocalculus taiwanensis]|uniref:ATP-grasp domain-containing protein n=1 Tax=Methanocalculus taiwanensis TaxID=106207 RepID=A0ABD4TJS4_9EURY|nr:ATP-grasp domain-containing protein [Methanocalculus taiwanensis]MCQ1538193.1 ATP-grasp domain-containing protein [Methanocalculus taiwanensis]